MLSDDRRRSRRRCCSRCRRWPIRTSRAPSSCCASTRRGRVRPRRQPAAGNLRPRDRAARIRRCRPIAKLQMWIGGPVEPHAAGYLSARSPAEDEDAPGMRITDDLYLSTSPELLQRMLEPMPPPRTRLIVGYSGWGPGQLEEELKASAWLLSDVDSDLVFNTPPERHVGDGHPPARRRSRGAADVARGALSRRQKTKKDKRPKTKDMSKRRFANVVVLCAVASITALLVHAQEARVPDAPTLQKMAARLRADRDHGGPLEAVRRRSPRARQARRRVEDHRRTVPAAGVGGQRGDAAGSRARRVAGRARAAAYFLINKGPWIALDHQRAFRPRRAREAGRRRLLPGGRVESGSREVDPVAARGGARARDRLLHGDPPRRQRRSRWCPTTSSIRASSRAPRRCCARRRRSPPSRR